MSGPRASLGNIACSMRRQYMGTARCRTCLVRVPCTLAVPQHTETPQHTQAPKARWAAHLVKVPHDRGGPNLAGVVLALCSLQVSLDHATPS